MKVFSLLRGWIMVALIASLSLTACSSANATAAPANQPEAASAGKGPLLAQEWAGYENDAFWAPFQEQHPDVKVDFSFVADDPESFAKAQSSDDVDIVHPCANYYGLFVEKGLVQPLDTSRLKYFNSIYPQLAKLGQVNGKQYFIPWDWGYEAILVRTDKVKNVPTAWADLWNPEYKGHLSLMDNGESVYLMTALSLGIDPYNASAEENAKIKQKLVELKPNLVNYWSDFTELSNLVANGDIWVVSNAWNETYAGLSAEGIAVDYVMPKEKAIGWACGYGISSKTKNLDLAYDYLNARMDPKSNAAMSNEQGYGPGNQDSIALMDEEIVKLLNLNSPDALDKLLFMRPLTDAQHQHFTDLWAEIKAAP